MTRSNPKTILLAASVVALMPFGIGAAMAGNGGGHGGGGGGGHGKGGGGGSSLLQSHGNSGGSHGKPTFVASNSNHGKPVTETCDDGDDLCGTDLTEEDVEDDGFGPQGNGAIASSLKGVNGAIHANEMALQNASANGMPGKARTFREAMLLEQNQNQLDELSNERTVEVIQAEIDALNPDDFATEEDYNAALNGLLDEQSTARTDAEVSADINQTLAEIDALDTGDGTQVTSEEAYNDLTGGRTLTQEAYDILMGALGLN